MTCCRAPRRASGRRASRGASFTSPSRRSTSIPATDPYDAGGLCQGGGEPRPHMIDERRADPRREPRYYVYRLTWRGQRADRPRRCRVGRRLRHQPHPQARADDAGEGGRPRPPDRGDQRRDRAGDDRLSRCARRRRDPRGSDEGQARLRRHRRRRRPPRDVGDRATPRRSTGSRAPSTPCPALYIADGHHRSAAASRVARARGKARIGATISSRCSSPSAR